MTTRWLALGLIVAALVLPAPARAFHTVFDFTIDRFEVDGNQLGPFDGTPDWVDDFNGTSLVSWYTPYGTSSVSGGRLHVQSPGEHYPGPDGTSLDFTEVSSAYTVTKNFGNFTATATFDPIIPPEGHFYHFTLFTFGGGTYFNELFGIDIHTLNGETRIEQHLVELDLQHGIYATVQTEGHTITAADLVGQPKFRVLYDDVAGTITSAFSLDGGATFSSPFSPAPIFTAGRSSAQFILGADPHVSSSSTTLASTTTSTSTTSGPTIPTTTTLPAATGCQRTDCMVASRNALGLRIRSRGRSLAWAWRRGPVITAAQLGNPYADGGTRYTLCVTDANGDVLFHEEIPAGGTCDGHPCWRASARAVTYRHASETDGITSIKLKTARSGSQAKATAKAPALLGTLPLAAPLVVQLEADTGPCWTSTLDDEPAGASARR